MASRLLHVLRRLPDKVDVRSRLAPSRPQRLRVDGRRDVRPSGDLWEPTGDDPHVVLQPPPWGGFPEGRVELCVTLALARPSPVEVEVHVDTGEGYSEGTKVRLPVSHGGAMCVPIALPSGLLSLRLDVPPDVGPFDLLDVTLRRLDDGDDLVWTGPQDAYPFWVARRDRMTEDEVARLRRAAVDAGGLPVISVVMPVHDPDPSLLWAAIESVHDQLWEAWELCICDDASTDPEVRRVLREAADADGRVRVTRLESNGGISRASNAALGLATGAWVALLDHDDLLAVDALARVAVAVNDHPGAAVVYSDEDKLDPDGRRYDPYFKPDFNRELLWGQNVVNHLGAYRLDVVREVGGFRPEFDGSQDLDLLLRVVEASGDAAVVHLPNVLYHWRASPGSVASDVDQKGWAHDAGLRAVGDHLERTGVAAVVEHIPGTTLRRVRLDLPSPPPSVTVVVPTRDRPDLLRTCLDGLSATQYAGLEVVVVDNGSRERATLDLLGEVGNRGNVRVLRDERPFNWAALNNAVISSVQSDLVLLCNDDVEVVEPDWLQEMVSWFQLGHVGAVGPLLTYPDGRIQHAGLLLGVAGGPSHAHLYAERDDPGQMGRLRLPQQVSAVTGACLLTRRSLFDELGPLDEQRMGIAYSDVDWCLRLRAAGHAVIWTPHAHLVHHESASRGSDTGDKELRRLRELAALRDVWGPAADHDPFFNPNLSQEHTDFRVAQVVGSHGASG